MSLVDPVNEGEDARDPCTPKLGPRLKGAHFTHAIPHCPTVKISEKALLSLPIPIIVNFGSASVGTSYYIFHYTFRTGEKGTFLLRLSELQKSSDCVFLQ